MTNRNYILVLLFILAFSSPSMGLDNPWDSSANKLKAIQNDSAYVSVATKEALAYFQQNKKETGLQFFEEVIRLNVNNPGTIYKLRAVQANLYYKKQDYEKSLQLTNEALKDSLKMPPKTLSDLYLLKAQNYFRTQNYFEAKDFFHQALSTIRKNKIPDKEDDVLANLATLYWKMGNLTEAVKYAQDALLLIRVNNDSSTLSRILNTMGNIYSDMGNKAEARKKYSECYEVALKINDREGAVLSLSSLSLLKRKEGDLDGALKMQYKVIQLAEEFQIKHLIGGAFINLASIYWSQGNLDSTRIYFNRALDLARTTNDPQNMAYILSNLGFLETESGNFVKSNEILQEGVKYAEEVADFRILSEIYGGMYDNYKATGQYKEALNAHEKYMDLRDSVIDQEKADEINRLTTKHAVAEKEIELKLVAEKAKIKSDAEINLQKYYRNLTLLAAVSLLILLTFIFFRYRERNKTNRILEEKNSTIEKSYKELKETQHELVETEKQREAQSVRVRIARDIHDEIGSGLTKITMISDLTAKKSHSKEIIDNLVKITSYSKNVSAALREIVWAINPNHDNLSSLVSYMKLTAAELLEDTGIDYQLDFPSENTIIKLNPDFKRNIYLVMKESIHNAIKYSKATLIKASFKLEDTNFMLQVSDNGMGFDPAESNPSNGGNGLVNMKNRMQQVNCSFEIVSTPSKGVTISAYGKLMGEEPATNGTT